MIAMMRHETLHTCTYGNHNTGLMAVDLQQMWMDVDLRRNGRREANRRACKVKEHTG